MAEKFRPVTHNSPDSLRAKVTFYLRMILDFQFASIFRTLKPEMADFTINLLDIGAGNSPFKHLLNKDVKYIGLDIKDADNFDYKNDDIIHYDGNEMPFENESFQHIICTEVLEHVENPTLLISETFRVLKPNGKAIFTIPWSARFHYQPYDYHRYTPSMLKTLFSSFRNVEIKERGTDVASMVAKLIVLYFRHLTSIINEKFNPFLVLKNLLVCIILLPFLLLFLPFGIIGMLGWIGSTDDPLGYTIILTK
jgi:SAM-dependent methyltransferase